jgi:Fe2+ or Zn2+ uptake regulation protein
MPAKDSIVSTKQKREVQAVIDGLDNPFTLQDVRAELAKSNSCVSRASIYRVVQSLCLSGRIQQVMLPDGRRVFVQACKGSTACIVECADCGKLSSLSATSIKRSLCRNAAKNGWTPLETAAYVRAACKREHCKPR